MSPATLVTLPPGFAPMFYRDDPHAAFQTREISVRSFQVRAESIDETSRSVEACIATEDPVTVMDWQRYELIDEVLRMDGAELPDQVPMLENHYRFSLDDQLGSARQLRVQGDQGFGRLYFAKDERSERAWQKVKERHVRDVSVGYRSLEYVDIPAGQSASVKGRSYTARQRTLRVTTRWEAREVSLTPIGADKRAKIRSEEKSMNPKLRKYLETHHGLRATRASSRRRSATASCRRPIARGPMPPWPLPRRRRRRRRPRRQLSGPSRRPPGPRRRILRRQLTPSARPPKRPPPRPSPRNAIASARSRSWPAATCPTRCVSKRSAKAGRSTAAAANS